MRAAAQTDSDNPDRHDDGAHHRADPIGEAVDPVDILRRLRNKHRAQISMPGRHGLKCPIRVAQRRPVLKHVEAADRGQNRAGGDNEEKEDDLGACRWLHLL